MSSFFFQAEDGIRDADVTGVQTCALPISRPCLRGVVPRRTPGGRAGADQAGGRTGLQARGCNGAGANPRRSEERRVGKECRSRGSACSEKEKGKETKDVRSGSMFVQNAED